MKKSEYIKFALKSYKLLSSNFANDVTLAISSLNYVKHHPEYFKKIDDKKFSILLKFFIINIFEIFKSLLVKPIKLDNLKIKKKNILLISHLTKTNQIANNDDQYFGNLEEILRKKKFNTDKILINHTGLSNFGKRDKKIFLQILPFKYEIFIFKEKFFEYLRLRRLFKITKDKNMKQIISNSMVFIFDQQTSFALRLKIQIEKYIKSLNPQVIITTFEGYGWERLCFQSAKKIKNNIKCIGYQHTLINHNNFSIYQNIKPYFNPDLIWCSDLNSFNLLRKYKKNKNRNIFMVGKFKKKLKIKINNKKILNKKLITCLVIPEGINQECLNLLNFSIKCLKQQENIKFIWRFHPITNIGKILNLMKLKINTLNKNIQISKEKSLNKDIMKSQFVLYRGSSVVVEPVKNGTIPLYLNYRENINIDPLKSCINKNNYINTVNDFFSRVDFYKKNNFNIKKLSFNMLKNFNNEMNKKNIFKSLRINE